MGRKPSSTPEIIGNVPRSKKEKTIRAGDESLWSINERDLEMADASNLLKVGVVTEFGSDRSHSVSTVGKNSVAVVGAEEMVGA